MGKFLTDEQIRMLAQCERMMDSGELPYVMWRGQRLPQTREAMEHFELKVGQTICDTIAAACLQYKITRLEEEIAKRATEEMMGKLKKKGSV